MSKIEKRQEIENIAKEIGPALKQIIDESPWFALGFLGEAVLQLPDLEHPAEYSHLKGKGKFGSRRQLLNEIRYIAICHARDWSRLAHPMQLEAVASAALNAMRPDFRNHFLSEAKIHFEGIDNENS